MQRMQVCTCMGVVIVSWWCCHRKDTDSCAHAQLNVSAATACVHVRQKLACTHEISLKTAILPVCKLTPLQRCFGPRFECLPFTGDFSPAHINCQPHNSYQFSIPVLQNSTSKAMLYIILLSATYALLLAMPNSYPSYLQLYNF